jgi:hypothetical protein
MITEYYIQCRTYDNSFVISAKYLNSVEMKTWAETNCLGDFEFSPGMTEEFINVLFEIEKDAIFFALRWS